MKKLIAVLLLAAVCFTSFAACDRRNDNSGEVINKRPDDAALNTLHRIRYTDTGKAMLQSSVTKHIIVLPADAPACVRIAGEELSMFFREATGVSLRQVTDDAVAYTSDACYISLGKTSVAAAAGVSDDTAGLKTSGYRITTAGNSIFVMGEERGVCNGVYGLLEIWFGFEQMTPTYYYLERGITDLPLYDFDITDVPDIDYRLAPYGGVRSDPTVSRRMRMMDEHQVCINGAGFHDMLLTIVPYDENKASHPKWFMSVTAEAGQNQLCYTAHGDPVEYRKMVDTAVSGLKRLIDADPDHHVATLTQMDYNAWCTCSDCAALRQRYGTDAASQIIFANDVAAQLKPWLLNERNDREVELVIFAFHKTVNAPAVQDKNGSWAPIDERVQLKDVSVWLAPIGGNFVDSVYDPVNAGMYDLCASWGAVAPSLFFWGYDCYFDDYLIPYDSYGSMQDLIRENVFHHVTLYWAQGAWNMRANTGFDNVKTYLYSRLEWNCQLDTDELLDNYFAKVYREAAPEMKAAYNALRAVFLEQQANGAGKTVRTLPKTAALWPSSFLFGQLRHFEAAKEALAKYQDTDPGYYATVMELITLESVSPRYLLLTIYPSALDSVGYDTFLAALSCDCDRLGVNMLNEFTPMKEYFSRLGKK